MFGFGSSKMRAGESYSFNITVAPVGLTGRQRVADCFGTVIPNPGETREDVEAALKARAIEECRGEYPDADDYIILSFQCD